MISRRDFIELATKAGIATTVPGCIRHHSAESPTDGITVNDVHSHLNPTRVHDVVRPESIDAVQSVVRAARRAGRKVSVSGGRHAMGGQQFATDSTLIDMNGLTRVIEFDRIGGEIEVEAGIQWPELYQYLLESQVNETKPWAFVQKQTGADKLSIGGALAANVHGRGLRLPPFVGDVIAFTIVGPDGMVRRCSRTENPELFRAAIGGYGLFGAVVNVRLRLTPRHKVQRTVEVIDIDDLPAMFDRRIAAGYQYGDFQFATQLDPDALLRKGVFSCYRPVDDATPMPSGRAHLTPENWRELILLAHVDRARAFQAYSSYYLTTSGQYYWSDEHQMSTYIPDYHETLGARLGEYARGTEMISEIYVPRDALVRFLSDVRSEVLTADRLNSIVFGGFAIVALAIAVVGVAGVLAFSVSARTREFGIRLAIGSQPSRLLAGVIAQGALIAAVGVITGTVLGYALARLANRYFDGMQMPSTLPVVASAFVLLAAAVVASALPAARAARVDVIQALRSD